MKQTYNPGMREDVGLSQEIIEVPAPLDNEEATPRPMWQKLMPLGMLGLMGLMMYVMSQMGGRNMLMMAPMMLMMPIMMIPMMMMNNGKSVNPAELNVSRKQWFRELDEIRNKVYASGEKLYNVQVKSFPSPDLMFASIGTTDGTADMWSFDASSPGGLSENPGTISEVSFEPYMSARIGRSVVQLTPELSTPELNIPELIEPVTGVQLRKFMRTQPYVADTPVGVSFNRASALSRTAGVALTGSVEEHVRALARSMVLSMAYNHSPDTLRIGVVTSNPAAWDWMKWLPHISHPTATDRIGPERMIWSTMEEFSASINPDALADESSPNLIVVIDLPDADVRNPFPTSKSVSYLVTAARADRIATDTLHRFTIKDGSLILPVSELEVRIDQVSEEFAEVFARRLSAYGTISLVGTHGITEVSKEDIDDVDDSIQEWHELIGMPDPETFNAVEAWSRSKYTNSLEVPIGYAVDDQTGEIIPGQVVSLDISDSADGGTGPHGVGSGTTGTGKSWWIKAFTMAMMAMYPPSKVSFIFMDFKGGSTFIGYNRLPHTIAVISNLASEVDMLDRAFAVISGLLQQRQELWNQLKIPDIREFRKRKAEGDFADVPDQPEVVIVVDEFGEFIKGNPQYKELFSSVGRVGRTLGVRIAPFSQYIDTMTIGELAENLGWGMTLRVENPGYSTAVIQSTLGASLPAGKGDGYLRKRQGPDAGLYRFRGFNIGLPYIPKRDDSRSATVIEHEEVDEMETLDNDIVSFTAASIEGDSEFEVFAGGDDFDSLVFEGEELPFDNEVENSTPVKEEFSKESQINAIIDSIARFNREDMDHAPRLWTPPMKIPYTYQQSGIIYNPNPTELMVNVGDLDDPFSHRRIPYFLNLSGIDSNTFMFGSPKSGKTMALQSVVSALNFGFPPNYVQTILLDYSGTTKLLEVADYPSVIGAATGREHDKVLRYTGAISSIMRIRQERMTEWMCSDIEDYFAKRDEKGAHFDDPYGHIVVVMDMFDKFYDILNELESQSMTGVPAWCRAIMDIITDGDSVGVHLVSTADKLPYRATKRGTFTPVSLAGGTSRLDDGMLADMPHERRRAYKETVQNIPEGQPGRAVDSRSSLHLRFRIPSNTVIEHVDTDEAGNLVYDQTGSYSEDIKELAKSRHAEVANAGQLPAVLHSVPDVVPLYNVLTSSINNAPRPKSSKDLRIPFAVSVSDITERSITTGSTIMAFGGEGSGKKTFLRDVIHVLNALGTPETVRVILYDKGNELWQEKKLLEESGLLAYYTENKIKATKISKNFGEFLTKRASKAEQLDMSYETIQERSWYDGPDFYLIINGFETFLDAGYGGNAILEPIAEAYRTTGRTDLGLTIIGAGRDNAAQRAIDSELSGDLAHGDPYLLRLAGMSDVRINSLGKFIPNLKKGRGHLLHGGTETEVQVAYTEPYVHEDDSGTS